MTTIADASPPELAQAIQMGFFAWALAHRSTPAVLEARLYDSTELSLKAPLNENQSAECLEVLRKLLTNADDQDRDIFELKTNINLALDEIAARPQLYQSMSAIMIGSGLIVILAILGKIKYKNKKWQIKEGFPGLKDLLEKLPKIFQD